MNLLPKLFLACIITGMFSCKIDKKEPKLSLIGNAILEIRYDSIASDPGAMASDETDGNLSSGVKSDWNTVVNLKQRAVYKVTYTVSDKYSNYASSERKVIVKMFNSNFTGNFNGAWSLTGTSYTGNSLYTISLGNHRNQFVISPYWPEHIALKVNLSGDLGENLNFNQSDGNLHTEGTGTIENDGKIIKLNFRRSYSNSVVIYGTETLTRL